MATVTYEHATRLYDGGDGRRRCHAHALLAPGGRSVLVAGTGVTP